MTTTAGRDDAIEEGEIKVIDDQNYVLSDSYFAFHWDKEKHINWRAVGSLHFDD